VKIRGIRGERNIVSNLQGFKNLAGRKKLSTLAP